MIARLKIYSIICMFSKKFATGWKLPMSKEQFLKKKPKDD